MHSIASGCFGQAWFVPAERERPRPMRKGTATFPIPTSLLCGAVGGAAQGILRRKTRGFAFFAYTQTVFISQIARLSDILRVNYRANRPQPHASTHILCNQLY